MKILFIMLMSVNFIISLYNWNAYAYYVKDSKLNISLAVDLNKEDSKTSEVEKNITITELRTKRDVWKTCEDEWRFKSLVDLLILIFSIFICYKSQLDQHAQL